MHVILAYPLSFDGIDHRPDERADLPDSLAAQLISDGRARPCEVAACLDLDDTTDPALDSTTKEQQP